MNKKGEMEVDIERLLKEKMVKGWNISIECKGKGREYEMTFEGIAYNVFDPIEAQIYQSSKYHGTGNTIEELLKNMFKAN